MNSNNELSYTQNFTTDYWIPSQINNIAYSAIVVACIALERPAYTFNRPVTSVAYRPVSL
jgi:hypothetical protein